MIGVTEHTKKIVEELEESVASYERMRQKKIKRLLSRNSRIGILRFAPLLNVDAKIIARKKYVIKQILHDYYVKTLEMEIAMKGRVKSCAGWSKRVFLDVKNHID